MKRFFILLLLVGFMGCSSPQAQPPLFSRGDTVRINSTEALGIIISSRYYFGAWTYELMTSADKPMEYQEDVLALEKRACWYSKKEVKAEIENPANY